MYYNISIYIYIFIYTVTSNNNDNNLIVNPLMAPEIMENMSKSPRRGSEVINPLFMKAHMISDKKNKK